MTCEVVCHQLRGPQGLYDTYGLRLTETGDFYGDITLDKAQARALAEALEKNGCEACHVPGVIDDFLAGEQF